jgi:site-specific DNA-methyltransferase (adenine-specific)
MMKSIAEALGGAHAVIPLADIEVSNRGRTDYGDLNDLALSLKEHGQLQNLVVRMNDDSAIKPFKLLAGGRRYAAMTKLEWTEANCLIFSHDLDELELLEIEFEENMRRKNLSWKEEVDFKNKIHALRVAKYGQKVSRSAADATEAGASFRDTARELGVSHTTMAIDCKLSQASEAQPELFKDCKTKQDAIKILKLAQETMIRAELAKRTTANASHASSNLNQVLDRYVIGDFFEGVKALPDRSFHLVEIDPPYAIALHDIKGGGGVDTKLARESYNEVLASDYLNFMDRTLAACYRVMSEHSWLILWHAPDPWFEPLYMLLEKNNFSSTRLTGKWIKPIGQTNQPSRYLANACEDFFYAWKGSPTLARAGRTNVFQYNPVPASRKSHPTERPLELMQELLATFAWEGSRILVPFLGSGKTILAAATLSMLAVGFELSPSYKDAFTVLAGELLK